MGKTAQLNFRLVADNEEFGVDNLISENGEELNADIVSGHKSTLLMQLGNIAQRAGRSLNINPENGHIIKDREANKLWRRSYEKGWEMKL